MPHRRHRTATHAKSAKAVKPPRAAKARHAGDPATKPEPRKRKDISKLRGDAAMAEYQHGKAMEEFRKRQPQFWLQAQRLGRVLEIQKTLPDQAFPAGACFLHANLVTVSHVCVRQIREVNLDTCQVTIEIHPDDHLEAGIIIIPLETVEWFGFPSRAVPTDIHFRGFTSEPATAPKAADKPTEGGGAN